MAIDHLKLYLDYIQECGVGDNDQVASSPRSYVSYLNGVSACLEEDITPKLLHCESDIDGIKSFIRQNRLRADGTIRNYGSAMRHYVNMVRERELWPVELTLVPAAAPPVKLVTTRVPHIEESGQEDASSSDDSFWVPLAVGALAGGALVGGAFVGGALVGGALVGGALALISELSSQKPSSE